MNKQIHINLQWTEPECKSVYFSEEYVVEIWQKQTIRIYNTGENWYSIEFYDEYGNEMYNPIDGGKTLEIVKQNVNTWIQEQLQIIL